MANQALRYTIEADPSQAEAAHRRVNTQLQLIEAQAVQTGRTYGSAFDTMAQHAIKGAEATGSLVLVHRAFRTELERTGAAAAAYGVEHVGMLTRLRTAYGDTSNAITAFKIANASSIEAAAGIAAGAAVTTIITTIAVKTVELAYARGKLAEQNALLAASLKYPVSLKEVTELSGASTSAGQPAGFFFEAVKALDKRFRAPSDSQEKIDVTAGLAQLDASSGRTTLGSSYEVTLRNIGVAFENVEDPVKRATLAIQLFGAEESPKILPYLNSQLDDSIDRLNKFGVVLGNDAEFAKFKQNVDNLKNAIGPSWLPSFSELGQGIKNKLAQTGLAIGNAGVSAAFDILQSPLFLGLEPLTQGQREDRRRAGFSAEDFTAEQPGVLARARTKLADQIAALEQYAGVAGAEVIDPFNSLKSATGPTPTAIAARLEELRALRSNIGRNPLDEIFSDQSRDLLEKYDNSVEGITTRLGTLKKRHEEIVESLPDLSGPLEAAATQALISTDQQLKIEEQKLLGIQIARRNVEGRRSTAETLISSQFAGGTAFDTALGQELRQIEQFTTFHDKEGNLIHTALDPKIASNLNKELRARLEEDYHKQNLKLFADAEKLEQLNKDQFFGDATSQLASDEQLQFFLTHELPAATQQFQVPSPTYRYVNGVPTLVGRTPGARAATYAESGLASENLGNIKESRQEEERLRIEALRNETGLQERLIELSVGPDVRRGIEETYGLRIDYANQEYEIQRLSLGDAMAGYKQGEEYDKARVERAEKLADLERSRLHEISGATESLTHTLFTDPSKFGPQFSRTIRDAFLRPIEEGIGTVVSKTLYPVIYGQEGNGGIRGALSGIFGGKSATRSVEISKLERPNGIGDMELVSGAVPVMIVGGISSQASSPLSSGLQRIIAGGGGLGGFAGGAQSVLGMVLPFLFPGLSQAAISGGGGGVPAGGVQSIIDFGGGNTYTGAETIYGGTAEGAEAIASSYGGGLSGSSSASSGGGGGIGGLLGRIFGGGRGGGGFGGFNLAGLKDFIGIGGYKVPGVDTTIPFGDLSSIAKIENIAGSPAAGALGSLLVNKGLRSPGYGGAIESTSGSALLGANIGKSIPGLGIAGGLQVGAGAGLAVHGLITDAGTIKGTLEGAAGGALIGEKFGGPIGALIGAGVGAGIGIGEELAGVESKRAEAVRLIHKIYGVLIDNPLADQVVNLAKQSYGGHVSLAVYSPEIRKIIELFAAATGQRVPQSATTPHGASLVEQGGTLYQEKSYNMGLPYVQPSGLPTLGGGPTGTFGNPSGITSPILMSFNIDGQGAGNWMAGNVVTPSLVQSRYSSAQNSSDGRLSNSALTLQPGLITG